jgi:hypothetical protein
MNIRIHFPKRKSASARVPNFTISADDLSMTVDIDNLPDRLYRLLPNVIAKASANEWRPFVVSAIALNLMR